MKALALTVVILVLFTEIAVHSEFSEYTEILQDGTELHKTRQARCKFKDKKKGVAESIPAGLFLDRTSLSKSLSKATAGWPIGLVRFRNDVCNSLEGYQGTCYTRYQCNSISGTGSGSCANGIGTCCIYQGTCGNTSSYNNTYFINPGFPNTFSDSTSCTFVIQRCNSDICQVRLDFLNLNLAQPDGNGNCVTDSLVITGGASNVPVICGQNGGQHVYINFNGDNDITLMITTSSAVAFARSWNIKVTQLACDCPSLAPTGCLMYYTALMGTVNSFNYGTTLSGGLVMTPMGARPGTRQLANLNYGVCVQMQPGYCAIQWSEGSDPEAFTVSGNTALSAVLPGLPADGLIGNNCTTDFVVIPNPSYPNGTAVNGDRFCGNQFPTVVSSSKPFVMTVVDDGDDLPDVANRGFSLNYRQIACTGTPGMPLMIPTGRR